MGGRNYDRKLTAIGHAVPGVDIAPLCADLVRRIKHIRNITQAGTYLLADSEGYLYILREQSPVAERWVRKLPRMIVGLYASGLPMLAYPSSVQLCADLIQHFVDIGLIRPPTIYGLESPTIANPTESCITATQTRSVP